MLSVPCDWRIERRRSALASLEYECVRENRIYSTKKAQVVLEVDDPGRGIVRILYRTARGNHFMVEWKRMDQRVREGYYQLRKMAPVAASQVSDWLSCPGEQ